jgi:hypothetical protein
VVQLKPLYNKAITLTNSAKHRHITPLSTLKQHQLDAEILPTPKHSTIDVITSLHSDGKLPMKQLIAETIANADDLLPPEIPLKEEIGKKIGLMWPRGPALLHSASSRLNMYSTDGCPVDCGPAWTTTHIIAALKRGAHPSAKLPTARACLVSEAQEKVKNGYARIIKWKDIKDNLPTNFKLSPVAMIPHKSRLYRCILDLSYQLKINGKTLPSVNSESAKLAPQSSMAELGNVINRIVHTMADPNHFNSRN